MKITSVEVSQQSDPKNKSLIAYATVIVDNALVIHDLKIVRNNSGVTVAMPSRKLMMRCPKWDCNEKNHMRARFCNKCGNPLVPIGIERPGSTEGYVPPTKLYADVVHPLNQAARDLVCPQILNQVRILLPNPSALD